MSKEKKEDGLDRWLHVEENVICRKRQQAVEFSYVHQEQKGAALTQRRDEKGFLQALWHPLSLLQTQHFKAKGVPIYQL